jgi:hypothetical protein
MTPSWKKRRKIETGSLTISPIPAEGTKPMPGEIENAQTIPYQSTVNWGLLIQLATMLFLAGIAYASFETKTNAKITADAMTKFNADTYMPRELSIEKWRNNDNSHEKIQRALDDILNEMRNSKKK